MKCILVCFVTGLALWTDSAVAQPESDPAHIEIEVTPFYDSKGPVIEVGLFSKGLASKSEKEFEETIFKMQKSWDKLSFAEMYVAAIRLYDLGYRKEAVYWFYSAQYRGRLFGMLVDKSKLGEIGDPGFELYHAQNAFYQLVGTTINGYGFGDTDHVTEVVQRVLKEGEKLPEIKATYRGIAFKEETQWNAEHKKLNEGLDKLLTLLKEKKDFIKQQRVENGTEAKFAKLKTRELDKQVEAVPKADKPATPGK